MRRQKFNWRAAAQELLDAGFLPIPAKAKHPTLPHTVEYAGASGPQWSRAHALADMAIFDKHTDIGILTDNIIILDFDELDQSHSMGRELMASFLALAPQAFAETAAAKTGHGMHFYFRRTPLCDSLGVFDGGIGYAKDSNGAFILKPDGKKIKKPMDIKTLTNRTRETKDEAGRKGLYRTPGFCSTPPSIGKVWIRSPVGACFYASLPSSRTGATLNVLAATLLLFAVAGRALLFSRGKKTPKLWTKSLNSLKPEKISFFF